MKRYNLRKIMKRAWEMVKTLGFSLSSALKKAWEEAKVLANKIKFEKYCKILKPGQLEGYGDSCYLFFKRWTKNGHDRIYVNDYKRRTIGFFENGEFTKYDNMGNTIEELNGTLAKFLEMYDL